MCSNERLYVVCTVLGIRGWYKLILHAGSGMDEMPDRACNSMAVFGRIAVS